MKVLSDYIKLDNGKYSNFTYGEFVKSDTALRLGINNTPNQDQWKNIELLVRNILQPVRDRFGPIRITSGYRSVALCIAVGSSSTSNHTRGQAADIEPYDNNIKLIDIITFIDDELEYRELILEFSPDGWCHVAYREGGNNRQLKLKDKNHDYDKIDLDYLQSIYKPSIV
jgi:hypothetical protein